MPATPVSSAIRSILDGNIGMPAADVIRKARVRGITAPEKSLRDSIYNIKSEIKKAAAKASSKPVPAAARTTKSPEPATAPAPVPEVVVLAPVLPSTLDLAAMLANVALVNAVVGACGGAETARKVAQVVQACGSVEVFLQHLDLVAGIRGGAPA